MLHREGAFHQFFDPDGLLCCQTFRTVPVATTVVAVTDFTAVVTGLLMPAQRSRTALYNIVEHFCLLWRQFVLFDELPPELPDYLRKLKLGPSSCHKACRMDCVP